ELLRPMPTQLYRGMRLPSAGQCAGGAKAYRMRPEKAQLCRGLRFEISGSGLRGEAPFFITEDPKVNDTPESLRNIVRYWFASSGVGRRGSMRCCPTHSSGAERA